MSNKKLSGKKIFPKVSTSRLQSIFPALVVLVFASLFITLRANADPANYSTGCIHNSGASKGKLYKFQVGTSPVSACASGDSQVSYDYGDIQSVTAGTGLSGGATQGDATLSIANGGVNTTQLANAAVTAAKISSGTAINGQVLTADGSGGASWQTPSGGSTNIPPAVLCNTSAGCDITSDIASHFQGKDLTDAIIINATFGSGVDLSITTFKNAIMTNSIVGGGSVDFSNDDFTGANLSNFLNGGASLNFSSANFTDANVQNFTVDSGSAPIDFSNANFTNANFSGSNFDLADNTDNVSGVTWSNTTCPDGTNSDNDSNTCVGHGF